MCRISIFFYVFLFIYNTGNSMASQFDNFIKDMKKNENIINEVEINKVDNSSNIKTKNIDLVKGTSTVKDDISNNMLGSKINPYSEEYYKIFQPFMNSQKNLNTLIKALNLYNKKTNNKTVNINNDAIFEESESANQEIIDSSNKNLGIIYLKSILYISKNNWVVWINDKKISNHDNDNNNEFFVKNINKNEISLLWQISRTKWKYINFNDAIKNEEYSINSDSNNIELILKLNPNKTFIAFENRYIDGKYKEAQLKFEDDNKNTNNVIIDSGEDIDFEEILNKM